MISRPCSTKYGRDCKPSPRYHVSCCSDYDFDSYMVAEDELELGELRLLEVDNRLVLPIQKHIRVIVTAADVLHC